MSRIRAPCDRISSVLALIEDSVSLRLSGKKESGVILRIPMTKGWLKWRILPFTTMVLFFMLMRINKTRLRDVWQR